MSIDPVEGEVERLTQMRPGHADLTGAVKYGLDDVRPDPRARQRPRDHRARRRVCHRAPPPGGVRHPDSQPRPRRRRGAVQPARRHRLGACRSFRDEVRRSGRRRRHEGPRRLRPREPRHRRRRLRGAGQRRPDWPRQPRAMGPQAGRAPCPGNRQHAGRQGRRDRRRLHDRSAAGLAGAGRHPAARPVDGPSLDARLEQRRRPRRGRSRTAKTSSCAAPSSRSRPCRARCPAPT